MTNVTADVLHDAHKNLMSALFFACQPNRGDVFGFMDDRPELLVPVLEVAIIAERRRCASLADKQAGEEPDLEVADALGVLAREIRRGAENGEPIGIAPKALLTPLKEKVETAS